MQTKKKRKTWTKIVAGIVILILAVFIGNVVLKSAVEKKLHSALQQFAPFVVADFSHMHVNLLSASIVLDSVVIDYHPILQQQSHAHSAYLPSVSLTGIRFFKLISSKHFAAGALRINKAEVRLDGYLLNRNDTLPASAFANVHLPFEDIFFSSIEIADANVIRVNTRREDSLCTAAFFLSDVRLDQLDSLFTPDSVHFSNITCELNNVKYNMPGYYSLRIKKFSLNSRDSSLEIKTLKMLPQLGKLEFGQKLGHQADRIEASVTSIKASGLDVLKLLQKKFYAHELIISHSDVHVFRDRRLPREMKEQPTPLGYLKKIPMEIRIGHFKFENADVVSEEMPKDGVQTGYIKIVGVQISMSPVLSKPGKKDPSSINAHVSGSIMNAGNIHATINLSLLSGDQHIKGSIDNLNLTAMNPSAENLGRFHIESGRLDRLDFNFTASSVKASGEIVGVYHDLVIDRLKKDPQEGKKVAWLPSFMLHHFIVPKNKDASMPVEKRTGKIDYARDPTRLVTFYLLKALLDGIRDSFALGFVLPK